jgi:hypothetical protein
MAESLNVMNLTVQLSGSLISGTALLPLIVAPSAAQGGGFTLLSAQYQAGTSTGVGTAFTLELVHGGAVGTALGGTVAAAIGGSAAASNFVPDTVYPFTLSGTLTFAAGDSLAVKKVASGVNMSPGGVLNLQYINGR